MTSPTKNNSYSKKVPRKNTFSQANISQSEVGDFQGGYFVMEPSSTPNKTKNNNKPDRSPERRKQQYHNSNETVPASPTKERNHTPKHDHSDFKKKHQVIKGDLLTPGSFSASNNKLAPSSPKHAHSAQYYESTHKSSSAPSSPSKADYMSSSPPGSGRWAGPAFGNAPHPSNLPLPEWTSDLLSTSPPVHDGGSYLGPVYQPLVIAPVPAHFSPPHMTSIPAIPFPYVSSHVPVPAVLPSLAQLSTDLRRMLNINGAPVVLSDPILVSANSS